MLFIVEWVVGLNGVVVYLFVLLGVVLFLLGVGVCLVVLVGLCGMFDVVWLSVLYCFFGMVCFVVVVVIWGMVMCLQVLILVEGDVVGVMIVQGCVMLCLRGGSFMVLNWLDVDGDCVDQIVVVVCLLWQGFENYCQMVLQVGGCVVMLYYLLGKCGVENVVVLCWKDMIFVVNIDLFIVKDVFCLVLDLVWLWCSGVVVLNLLLVGLNIVMVCIVLGVCDWIDVCCNRGRD